MVKLPGVPWAAHLTTHVLPTPVFHWATGCSDQVGYLRPLGVKVNSAFENPREMLFIFPTDDACPALGYLQFY